MKRNEKEGKENNFSINQEEWQIKRYFLKTIIVIVN